MKTCAVCLALLWAANAALAGIEAYTTVAGTRKIVTIPASTSYTMTASDVTYLANADVVKLGEGTLSSGAEMAAYTGNIFIRVRDFPAQQHWI